MVVLLSLGIAGIIWNNSFYQEVLFMQSQSRQSVLQQMRHPFIIRHNPYRCSD
jgi:hypothetical protein